MQQRLIELQLQRGRLLERIAQQRDTLAQQTAPVSRVLHIGDRVADIVRDCKRTVIQNPLTTAAVLGAVVVMGPRRVLRWSQRGFLAWRSWNTVRSAFARYITPPR